MLRTDAEEAAIEVEVSDTQGHLRVDPAGLSDLVRSVLVAEGRPRASISLAIVDRAAIHAINRAHLGHDWPTDVISFPLSGPDDPVLAGELVVSAEMAAAMAAEMGVEPVDELALYVVHGLLHLCGHDDLDEASAAAMRRREGEHLTALGRPSPIDRDGPARAVGHLPPGIIPTEPLPWSS